MRRRRFVLNTLSPFIFNRRAEPQRKLQTSRPLSCAEERAEPRQVAKTKLLNEHHNSRLRVCIYAIACWRSLRFFPFVCVPSSRGLGGRVDNVALTLEERVSLPLLCCGAIIANESNKCTMYNSEHPAFLHQASSYRQHSLPGQ